MTVELWSKRAEQAVIGAVLLQNSLFPKIGLSTEDFYSPPHRAIWDATAKLFSAGKVADPITICELAGDNALIPISEAVGGYIPSSSSLVSSAEVVRDHAQARAALVIVSQTTRKIQEGLRGDELRAEMRKLAKLSEVGVKDKARFLPAIARDVCEQVLLGREQAPGLQTGLSAIDELTGGLQPGVVTIIAGRPSTGKSSLARTMTNNIGMRGEGAHVFSMEDRDEVYARRSLSEISEVELQDLMRSEVSDKQQRKLASALGTLASASKVLIDDGAGLTSEQIAQRVSLRKDELNTKLVVIDYIQLMRAPKGVRPGDNKSKIDAALEGLGWMAREENLPVLVLSQLSRQSESRPGGRPILSDLRESGELEQSAYAVMFTYQPWRFDKSLPNDIAQILLAKNKNGPTGSARLKWDAKCASFRNLKDWE